MGEIPRPERKNTLNDVLKWSSLDEAVSQVRDAFGDVPTRKLKAMIDEAVANLREEKRR